MAQSNDNRLFFANKLTLGQLLTWRPVAAIFGAGLLIAGLVLFPKLINGNSDENQKLSKQSVYVKTAKLKLVDDFTVPIWYTGQVNARRKTATAFQRGGKVAEILFDEGDFVKIGEVIARMDSRQLTARSKQLDAERRAAEARLTELREGPRIQAIQSAQANVKELENQLENAQRDFERADSLLPQGAVSAQEHDQAKYLVTTLEQRIASANAQLDQLKVGTRIEQVNAAEAALDSAKAASNLANHDLDDCILRAPFTGTITRRMVDEGAVLDTGQPVFELVESNHLELKVGLPIHIAQQLTEGLRLDVDVEGILIDALVKKRLLALDPTTQTQNVILTFDESAAGRGIVDNQMGRVKFEQSVNDSGFVVPTSAIVNDQQGLWSCFTVEEQQGKFVAKRQAITVLHFQGDFAFVKGTITSGQSLVTDGLQKLTNGQVVQLADSSGEQRR